MILGLRTVVYYVRDLDAAKSWYSKVLERGPYFDTPYYVGYSVGGFELGLHPAEGKATGSGGQAAYWGVADIAAEVARMTALGAKPTAPVQDVGEGIKVVELADPFGNLFGLIENPHFKVTEVR
jgi:predicted enzyme related to lactoylglutathione lyase